MLRAPVVTRSWGHAGPIFVASNVVFEENAVGGSHLLAPVGGRENGIPKNCRTLGEMELVKPLIVPVLVVT